MRAAPACTEALDAFFASYYRRRPVTATFVGVHDYDECLPDYSPTAVAEILGEMESLRNRLRAVSPVSAAGALDRRLAAGFLDIQLWEYTSAHFLHGNPCVYTGEAVFGVIALFLREFAPLSQRAESAIARMSGIPRLLAQGRANVRRAPRAWVERAVRECAGARAFFSHGIGLLAREPAVDGERLRAAAARADAAFAEFQHYLEVDLAPRAHEDYACGSEAFALLLRRGHFLDRDDPTAIRDAARARLARCEGELRDRAAEFGASSWPDALAQLAGRHPSAARYYARYAEVWEAAREAACAHALVSWPEWPVRYVPQPEWARAAAPSLYFLAYRSPPPFDRLPAAEHYVPPLDPDAPPDEQRRRLRAANDGVIKLNYVIHHGGLGHHVQNWYAARAESRVGRIAAVDAASRIAMFCGGTMAEGWACYATDLMEEIGFLSPLERYAQVHARLRMAARAFVDVELHRGAMTLEEAAALYQTRVGMPAEAAQAEAVKNSLFPATGLMYMVGADLLHELRGAAGAESGTVDRRRFHDRLLSCGSVPVALAATAMRQARAGISEFAPSGGEG